MLKASIPAHYVLILIDLVEGLGFSRKTLLAGTDLAQTTLSSIGARVDSQVFSQLVANAFKLTGDPALGLKLGLKLNLSAHAILGQAFMTCADLSQVLQLLLKYSHLLSSDLELALEVTHERCTLTIVRVPINNRIEFTYELLYGAMRNTMQGLLNLQDIALQLEVPYPAPSYVEAYYKIFGEAVQFNRPLGRLCFDRALLNTPLPLSNPALRALYENECARLLAGLEKEASMAKQTLRLLYRLEGQYPQMPVIAQMLNVSPRTYRRRLKAEHQSFQGLLNQVRAEQATHYLKNTQLPLCSIAYQIGFNDTSNFRRAYMRWTGNSPSVVRKGCAH